MTNNTFNILLSSQGNGTLPIGTILPYVGDLANIPHGWFLCDGTNGTPDLRDRFLEGGDNPRHYREAGLPNITGMHYSDNTSSSAYYLPNGVYQYINGKNITLEGSSSYTSGWLYFDASRCSPIYGRSNTVQPASYVVYYIIRIT